MASVLRMPGVSADATEAALLEWSVEPGAAVKRGDVLASVETEKAVVELEAEEDAVLFKTLAVAGELVPIGGPLAILIQPGEEAQGEAAILDGLGLVSEQDTSQRGPQADGPLDPEDEERSQDALMPGADVANIGDTADAVAADAEAEAGTGTEPGRVFTSPLARRLAGEAGLPLTDLQGTGPGGRIRRRDIEAALRQRASEPAAAPPPEPEESASTPSATAPAGSAYAEIAHSRFRRAVANALTASKQQVPHFYLKATCRVDSLLDLRREVNAGAGVKITINDFLVKAAARAMVEVPDMNVVWTAEAVRRFDTVDIAIAVDSPRGLLTPVLRSVQSRSLSDISAGVRDLAARAGSGALKQQELEGGALTISNLGMYGVEEFTAIINPPQAGILAVGAASPRPVPLEGGGVGFGQFITAVLSADHRPVDGALAARWLAAFRELVENPLRLLI